MSLTKKALLEALDIDPPEFVGNFFGMDLYAKTVSEFQRSRRFAQLANKKGDGINREQLKKARIFAVVDHLCDKDGTAIFSDKDVDELMKMDALKLDLLTNAIEKWVEEREGNFQTGSSSS